MRVTIVLETGAFFTKNDPNQTYFDVGYFETPSPSDIEVFEDGNPAQPPHVKKIGNGNIRLEVEHVERDGVTVRQPVRPSPSFTRDILKKDDLYAAPFPAYLENRYDCIFRFHSGDFRSAEVRPRRFTEHRLSDDQPTGNDKTTRPIANEIHVDFDVDDGEVLRLRAQGRKEVWSTASIKPGTKSVVVKIKTDDVKNPPKYHKTALNHQIQTYYLPNSDPPPMDGP